MRNFGYATHMADELKQKEHVFYIETDKIIPNPEQPRRVFSPEALESLAASIREYGILQPIVVTRVERMTEKGQVVEYEIIAGERRFRASQLLGLREIPAIIRRQESAKVKLELALIENVQREDLNPIERALAYQRLIDEFSLTQKEVALRIGKSRESVANTLRLLNLPEMQRIAVSDGRISEGHTRPLLMLVDYPEEQQKLYTDIIEKSLSVRQAEQIARNIAIERSTKYKKQADPETREVESKLGNVLGANVTIVRDKHGKGRISIEFFSEEELAGIAAKIGEKLQDMNVASAFTVASTPSTSTTTPQVVAANSEITATGPTSIAHVQNPPFVIAASGPVTKIDAHPPISADTITGDSAIDNFTL